VAEIVEPDRTFIRKRRWQYFIGAIRENVACGMTWLDALEEAVASRWRKYTHRDSRLRLAENLLREPAIAYGIIAFFDKWGTALPTGVEDLLKANIRAADATGRHFDYRPISRPSIRW
jgi:hypothetical protein